MRDANVSKGAAAPCRPQAAVSRSMRWWILVCLVVLGVCAALSVVELWLRRLPEQPWKQRVEFGPFEWLDYHPFYAWMNRAGFVGAGFRINSLHLRGPEVTPTKPAGTIRIVCLGDSRTFGIWQDVGRFRFDNAYAPALQALARADGRNVEVLNAGVIGYSSAHGLRQLVAQLLPLVPDVLVVGFGINDASLAWNPALRALEPHSFLGRSLAYGARDLRAFQLGLSILQGMPSLFPPALTVPWVDAPEYAYNLRRFAEVSAAHHIHLLFLNLPLRALEVGEDLPAYADTKTPPLELTRFRFGVRDLPELHRTQQRYAEVLDRVAAETGTPIMNIAATFAVQGAEPPFGRYDLVHWNVTGARLIARSVYTALRDSGWLAPPAALPRQ